MLSDKLGITRHSNTLAFGVIDSLFRLVGVTFVQRETQNQQPGKAEAKASNAGGCLGVAAYVSIGSPVSRREARSIKALSISNVIQVGHLREDSAGLQPTICLHPQHLLTQCHTAKGEFSSCFPRDRQTHIMALL
jgi:hypothetical protein